MPDHPTHKAIFQTKYPIKFAEKPSAIPTFGLSLSNLLNDISIEPSDIAEYQEPYNPVWTIDQPVIRLDLRVGIKKGYSPNNFISHFIYTDDSKTENAVGCAASMGSNSLK